MTRVGGAWRDRDATQALLAALAGAGHQALFVGGCVRNALLGIAVADVDICTDAAPDVVTRIAGAAGFKVVPTGIEHGTVTVVAGEVVHEVTTFRRDVATDGRRARVAFSADIAEDAARRDLTINALYARPDGAVIDPLGALPDLFARRVRFVGQAEARIREDYLRILRFFRFHAHFADPGHGLDAEALAACAANIEGLARLSKERIGQEMRKLLSAPDPAPAVAAMAAAGVLGAVLPGADALALAPLVHLEAAEGLAPGWLRRLAALGGQEPAEHLKLSRAEGRALSALGEAARGQDSPAVLGFRLKAGLALDALAVRAALTGVPLPPGARDEVQRGASAVFPLRAADLPALSGPALGARLKALQEVWLQTGLTARKADLLSRGDLPG
ncbi:MAG: CCA tRNA nucleotidyltransferase [Paracoccaceae bacterium]